MKFIAPIVPLALLLILAECGGGGGGGVDVSMFAAA